MSEKPSEIQGLYRQIRTFGEGGDGAGEGNRTLVVSLGSFCSTIELHPHFRRSGRSVVAQGAGQGAGLA
jgi:hypothetical protein